MEEMSKHLRCPKCGMKMKEIARQEDMFLIGPLVISIPDTEYLSTLKHYVCPEKHIGIIMIPVIEWDKNKWDAMKARRYAG